MAESRAAYRYARAFLGVAAELQKLDEVTKDLQMLECLLKDSKEFLLFVKSPVVNKQKKKIVFREIVQGRISDVSMKFIELLASKEREALLPEIIQQFYRLRDDRLGIANVTTRSVSGFTEAQEKELISQLEAATRKKVRMTHYLDPSLKGGFTIQHDDTVWDASVRHQLEVLRRRFIDGTA